MDESINAATGRADVHRMLADKEGSRIDQAMHLALADGNFLREMLQGLRAKDDALRYNCFKVLLQISESQPLVLYPEWDYLVELLGSSNSYHRSSALCIIANLASVDTQERLDAIFDQYFRLLDDESLVVARYAARNAGKIASSKPHLQRRISEKLLDIGEIYHNPERRDLIKADVIESFEAFFEESEGKETILAFVEEQLGCSSPKTRKAAKEFLNRHGP